MQKFRDKDQREWEIDLAFGEVIRVKKASQGKFDLLDNPDEMAKSLWNLGEFYEFLWYLLEPQAKAHGIADAYAFGKAVAARCILEARDKFFEEYTDFFRQLQREEVATALEKTTAAFQTAATKAKLRAVELMGPKFDRAMEAKVEELLKVSFGQTRESLESILGASLGDNCD